MAVRQYVGARYVPKFYQNSQNPLSSEWESNKAYEAMTVITYNNSSYTSKIPVPAGIGNPAQNPSYWALTANYNAQVEQYRQETKNVSDKLSSLQSAIETETNKINDITKTKTNIILFGDSWADTRNYGTDVTKNPSATRLQPVLEQHYPFATVHNYAFGGSSFTGGISFEQQLNEFINDNIDPSTIYMVILMGGVNQITKDKNTTVTEATTFFNNLSKHIWQSTPVYWFQNFSLASDTINKISLTQQYQLWCSVSNDIPGNVSATNVIGWFSDMKDNKFHPTYDSYLQLAYNIVRFIERRPLKIRDLTFKATFSNPPDSMPEVLKSFSFIVRREPNCLNVYAKIGGQVSSYLSTDVAYDTTFTDDNPGSTLLDGNTNAYIGNSITITNRLQWIINKKESVAPYVGGYITALVTTWSF